MDTCGMPVPNPPPIDTDTLLTWLRALPEDDRERAAAVLSGATDRTQRLIEPPPAPPPRRDRTGEIAGAFALRRLIGRGGMGEVWLAERQDADFEQRVAVKLIQSGAEQGELLRRFLMERRILSSLHHPNIARLVDGGRTSAGEPYLAMEYVDGVPLDVHVRERGLRPRARIELLLKVCEAVAYAQDRLIVHRDLKPANVLVDSDGEPRVLDFGIAKLLSQDDGEATQAADRAFTPAYAAPEQLLGEPVSASTDVYALGVILYQLLTGQLPKPKRGGSLVKPTALERPSREISQLSPAEIETRYGAALSPAALTRQLAGDLDWIVVTATQADPAQRYRNAAELAADLSRWLAGQPLRARSASRWYRIGKLVRQHWLVSAALTLALVSMIAGSALALIQARVAAAAAARAEAEAAQASQTRDFIVNTLTGASPLQARQGRALTVSDALVEALPRLDTELSAAPRARAELRVVFANVLTNLGDTELALAQLDQAEREIAAEYGPVSQEMATVLQSRAILQGQRGDEVRQLADGERALAILGQLPGKHAGQLLQIQTTLVKVASRQGRYHEALARYQDILQQRIALYGADDPRVAVDHNNISVMQLYLERYDDAVRSGERALALLRSDPTTPRARQAWVLNSIGAAQWAAGDWSAALKSLSESIAIGTETLGANAEPVAIARNLMAQTLHSQGQTAEAEAEWRAIEASGHKDGTGVLAQVQYSLARALAERGRLAEALPAARLAVERVSRFRAGGDPMLLRSQALLSWILAANGEVDAGVALLQPVLEAVQASTLTLDEWGDVQLFAARLEDLRGRPEAAAAHRAEAERRWRAALAPDNPRLAALLASLARRCEPAVGCGLPVTP